MPTGFGLLPIQNVRGGVPLRVRKYYVPSTDSSALYIGDSVELVNAMDPKSEVSVIKRLSSATNKIVGQVVGFVPEPTLLFTTGNYRAASTNRYVLVCDDVDAVLEAQEDADSGVVSAANIAEHYNISLIIGTGSASTGMSGDMLDSSTAATSSLNFKILGVKRDGVNKGALTTGSILQVINFLHAFTAADSIT